MSEFMDALTGRRSMYAISKDSPVPDDELAQIVKTALKNLPTAFNMQSTCAVLLLGTAHQRLWDIVFDALAPELAPDRAKKFRLKLNTFAAGYGTVLFFNDEAVTERYMLENPRWAENFPGWTLQQNGMLQVSVWMALEERGLGASLQHYNPVIDELVQRQWDLPKEWRLLAQMPFGAPTAPAGEKVFRPVEERFRLFP